VNLNQLGWDGDFENQFLELAMSDELIPARVVRENKERYELISETGTLTATVSGLFSFNAVAKSDYPAVGDWVIINVLIEESKAIIHKLLPRRSQLTRKVAGTKTDEQVIAANIDTVFVIVGLDTEFNLRRIERYLTQIRASGADPVILLNKADLCDDPMRYLIEASSISEDAPVYYLSAINDNDFSYIEKHLTEGRTASFIGSSGTGKSTIINRLLGSDQLKTGDVSDAISKGRHTTTWRELIILPNGGIVIDTPGMRELQLWADEETLSDSFQDIEELISNCRFRDCRHETEPGCAILQAIESNELDRKRFSNYLKMSDEIHGLDSRRSKRSLLVRYAKMKEIAILSRKRNKVKF